MAQTTSQTVTNYTKSEVTTPSAPELRPFENDFGAEIFGLTFKDAVTDEMQQFLQDAVIKYGFVMVRGTSLTDDTHVELARKFGELDDVTPYNKAGRKNRLKYDELFDVSNVEEDGSLVDPESPKGQANKGNAFFHVDSSFNPRRASYSLLLAHCVPPLGNGGQTAFADTRRAYADLDPHTKEHVLPGLVGAHSIIHSKKAAAPGFFADKEPTDYPMGRHYVAQTHEASGRMNLYIASHVHHFEGLSPAAEEEGGKGLFDRLYGHATQDRYTVMVEWEGVGDLLVWDNTCTMHRACGGAFEGRYKRDMRRATVHDGSSMAWGLNEKSDVRQGLP